MNRRRFIHSTLGAAGAVLMGSCNLDRVGGPSKERIELLPAGDLRPSPRLTLKMSGQDVGTLAPFSFFPPAYTPHTYIYDSLLWRDATGKIQPWLATSHQASPDGLTHTFQIREGVRWHDGRPFTPEDVAFTFDYWRRQKSVPCGRGANSAGCPGAAPWVIFRPENVAGARVTQDKKVEVTLDKPAATFVDNVAARLSIVPEHVWSPVPIAMEEQGLTRLVGTGPYRLRSHTTGGYLFVANDQFFLGKPFFKRIEMRLHQDELVALKAGEADIAAMPASPTSAKSLRPFQTDPSFRVMKGDPDFLTALHWNLGRGGALADVRFRRACALAIDRKDMVRRLLGGDGHPGNPGFLAPSHPDRVDVEQYAFNVASANQTLDAAGFPRGGDGVRQGPDGKPLRFELKGPRETADTAQIVIRSLKEVGVDLNFRVIQEEFTIGGNYDMALLLWAGVGRGNDADFMRIVYSEQPMFFSARGYRDKEFDDLAVRQLVTLDKAERKKLIARMQQIVARDLPLLHLFYPTPFFIFRRSAFDQWAPEDPLNKQVLVTGVGTGGTRIRPIE